MTVIKEHKPTQKPWEIYILLFITIGFLIGSIAWEFYKAHF